MVFDGHDVMGTHLGVLGVLGVLRYSGHHFEGTALVEFPHKEHLAPRYLPSFCLLRLRELQEAAQMFKEALGNCIKRWKEHRLR